MSSSLLFPLSARFKMSKIEIPQQNPMIMKQGMKKKAVFPIGAYLRYWKSLKNKYIGVKIKLNHIKHFERLLRNEIAKSTTLNH